MQRKKTHNIPKLLPPKTDHIFRRDRLFSLLHDNAEQRAIWICSPAGSGKTSLVSSYIKEKALPSIWYQTDEGDADIASFFYYLGLAARAATSGNQAALPLLTPEYASGIAAFSRNFFRKLFASFTGPAILVFDNYHDVPIDSPLHEVMQIALQEALDHITIIIISRTEPPSAFARLRSIDVFSLIGWEIFRLSHEESNAIGTLRSKYPITKECLDKIYQVTQGWLAGLVLLVEQIDETTDLMAIEGLDDHITLFDYFTHEVFLRADKETQDFLLMTSLLPSVTVSTAKQLTGLSNTKYILAELVSQQFFIVQRGQSKSSFEYHPLFRRFLIDYAGKRYSEEQINFFKHKSGQLLTKSGDTDAAIDLFIQSASWSDLEKIITKQAQTYINHGRHATLEAWLRNVPEDELKKRPWLFFYLAYSKLQNDPIGARPLLEQSYEGFKAKKDPAGLYLCLSNIIESFVFAWDTFAPLKKWIQEFEQLQGAYPKIPGIEIKARVTMAVFSAMVYGWPQHPQFAAWKKRTENLFQFVPIKFIKVMIGAQLSIYYMATGEMEKYRSLVGYMESLHKISDLPPLVKLFSSNTYAGYCALTGDLSKLKELYEQSRDISQQKGVGVFDNIYTGFAIQYHCIKGEITEARRQLRIFEENLQADRELEYAYYLFHKSRIETLSREIQKGLQSCIESRELCGRLHFNLPIRVIELTHAQLLQYQGNSHEALCYVDKVLSFANETKSMLNHYMASYVKAWIFLEMQSFDNADRELQKAFSIGSEQGYFSDLIWDRNIMEALCNRALSQGIEVAYAQQLIRLHNFSFSEKNGDENNWPWSVKIRTFGGFDIRIDGAPVDENKKGMVKPLEMLKVLIAFGGRNVNEQIISDTLWPDADGDQAKQNFKTTLYRLRKLFTNNDVLVLKNRTLSLDSRYCWVDSWSLLLLLSRVDEEIEQAKQPNGCEQLCKRLIELYTDEFLSGETSCWVLNLRERLRTMFVRRMLKLADQLEKDDRIDSASNCYHKVIDIEPLTEEAYQGLMRCCLKQDRRVAAAAIYKACKTLFNEKLGVGPSKATEEIYAAIFSLPSCA